MPVIVRGEGAYIYDDQGKRYLDGLAGLFVVQVGPRPRRSSPRRRPSRPRELAFFPLWSYAHPHGDRAGRAARRATRPATSTGSSSPPAAARPSSRAWKLAKQYFKLIGKPDQAQGDQPRRSPTTAPRRARCRSPASRRSRQPFEPLVPGALKVPNTNFYRAPAARRRPRGVRPLGRRPDRARRSSSRARTRVAAVFLEPVQNSGGCFPPPPGYFERVREICDEYDVLLVSDEVICAFGRIGDMFALRALRLPARHHHLRQGHDLAATPRSAR